MSALVSQTFSDLFSQLFAMLDRWEFWDRLLPIVIAFAIFNGVTTFFHERILETMPAATITRIPAPTDKRGFGR